MIHQLIPVAIYLAGVCAPAMTILRHTVRSEAAKRHNTEGN